MSTQKWLDLARTACEHAGISYGQIEIITTWEQTFTHNTELLRNNAVLRIADERILKLYRNNAQRQYHIERAALQTFAKHGTILAPKLIASGELASGQLFVIMTEIGGESLQAFWEIRDELSQPELLKIARDIGQITTTLHQLPVDELLQAEKIVGGKKELLIEEQAKRLAEIDALDKLSDKHKAALRHFTLTEGLTFLDVPSVLTHSDFSWAHIFVERVADTVTVTGFIDWAEAMLGPAEWDIAFHWLWTFSQDKATMREFLKTYYPNKPPARLARRLFAAHYYTFSMEEAWDYFTKTVADDDDIVREIIMQLFPPAIFGSPD